MLFLFCGNKIEIKNSWVSKFWIIFNLHKFQQTGVETVHHFLFYCPLWIRFRSNIRDISYKHNRWGNRSFLMRGWSSPSKDGEEQAWKPNKEQFRLLLTMQSARVASIIDRMEQKEKERKGLTNPVGEESQTPTKKLKHYLHSSYYVPYPTLTLHIYRQSCRFIRSWQPETHPRILMCHMKRKDSRGFHFLLVRGAIFFHQLFC